MYSETYYKDSFESRNKMRAEMDLMCTSGSNKPAPWLLPGCFLICPFHGLGAHGVVQCHGLRSSLWHFYTYQWSPQWPAVCPASNLLLMTLTVCGCVNYTYTASAISFHLNFCSPRARHGLTFTLTTVYLPHAPNWLCCLILPSVLYGRFSYIPCLWWQPFSF